MFSFRRKSKTEISSSSSNERWMFIGWKSAKKFNSIREGRSKNSDDYFCYLHMQSLVEEGTAKWEPEEAPRGCLMDAEEGCLLPPHIKKSFKFPPVWAGSFNLLAPHPTHSPDFTASIQVIRPNGKKTKLWKRLSCLLVIDGDEYSLTPQQLNVMKAFDYWNNTPQDKRVEADHQHLLANLQKASKSRLIASEDDEFIELEGAKIDVGFGDLKFVETDWEISLKELPDGGLKLVPVPTGDNSISADDILKRLKHLQVGKEQATLRINDNIITLSPTQTKRSQNLLDRGNLSPEQKKEFLKDPTQYLSEHIFDPDSVEWSPRVKGIEEWTGSLIDPIVDGGMGQDILGIENEDNDKLDPTSEKLPEEYGSNKADQKPKLHRYLPYPHLNLTKIEFSECLGSKRVEWGVTHKNVTQQKLDISVFKKSVELKPHQTEAIKWMLAHNYAIENSASESTQAGAHFAANRGGILLADDMGLGKTLSVLSFFAMHQRTLKKHGRQGSFLVVAPVSLLITWRNELEKFFEHEQLFNDIIILHPEHDLPKFRTEPKAIDQITQADDGSEVRVKNLALKTSSQYQDSSSSIDQPGNIVLTNYETVQRFRFSFCAAKWEALALDEAQATKNPNIMKTAAVKSLNARFRILMTGTPVENSLVDFWCLTDTHSPGLLSSLQDFKKHYISRLKRAASDDSSIRKEIANEIKSQVGETMLRRMKTDILDKDFPSKYEHSYRTVAALRKPMSGRQLEQYDKIRLGGSSDNKAKDHHLTLLHLLRLNSLHPDLTEKEEFPIGRNKKEALEILSRSIKGRFLIEQILPQIESKSEKVLIFAITKKLQWGLARNLEKIFPKIGQIPIINGDTKIKTTRSNPSRQQLIDNFQNTTGFHICILSPVAAGVGLTITAANHVVHFERHWNPAKESQATDRAYRIGQTKDVHVWLPMSLHPDGSVTSFDLALDQLMQRKIQIQDSILNVDDVTVGQGDLANALFPKPEDSSEKSLWNTVQLKNLSPDKFEALIACLYEKCGASKCELTRRSGDSGADVIAYDYPTPGKNTLIDAKHTKSDHDFSKSDGIKQVAHAKNIYENELGVEFECLQVVSNAKKANAKIKQVASISGVELIFEQDLLDLLINFPISLAKIDSKLLETRISVL